MHLLEVANQKILLDCGLSFGNHPDVQRRNKQFPFAPDAIDAVVLSHAHVDHCGNLPNLVRQGFTGPIYCTPATRDLTAVMLADSAKIQEEDAFTASLLAEGGTPPRPLYTHHDADLAISQCVAVPYGKNQPLNGDVQLRFADAGHVLGSAMVVLTMNGASGEHTLAFTGDLGRRGLPFLHEPMPVPEADLLICESTYGGRTHKPLAELAEVLADVVTRTVERGGKVLVPAFSLGRAQIVVYYLQQWMDEGRLPRVPIYVDSPLACDIAEVYRRHTDCLSDPTLRWLGDEENGGVNYVRSIEESRQLSTRREPSVIVASGGMCEAGRVLHHLQHLIDDPRCSIVLVSYQSPQSLGQRLRERGPTVRFVGKKWNKWAEVVDLNGFSGHADHNDFLSLLGPSAGRTKKVSLVHGDPARAEQLATALRACGFGEVGIPGLGETVSLAS